MNAYQMVKHCTQCDDMYQGKTRLRRPLVSYLLGKLILKKVLKEGVLFGKNSPTSPTLITIKDSGDIEQQKKEWLSRIEKYANFNVTDFVHPFFGAMTREQIGIMVYKHADHHLRQFGA